MGSQSDGTQEYLLGAIERLVAKKSFADISVSELTKVAGISRMTFYRHYQNITDILTVEIEKLVAELNTQVNLQTTEQYDTILLIVRFLSEHADFIKLLLRANQQNILGKHIAEVMAVMSANKQQLADFSAREIEYYVKYHATGLTSVIVDWIARNQPEAPEELAKFLDKNTQGAS